MLKHVKQGWANQDNLLLSMKPDPKFCIITSIFFGTHQQTADERQSFKKFAVYWIR